tara:strand:- start:793 stop:1383 length:591 start_codon:yes stop_codon:yes gene_type:complete
MKLANVDSLTETFIDNLEERGMMRGRDSEAVPMKDDDDKEKVKEDMKDPETEGDLDEGPDKFDDETLDEIDSLFEEEDEEDLGDMEAMDDEEDMGDMDDMDDMDDLGGGGADPEMGAADMSLTEEEAQLLIDLGKRLEEAMGSDAEEAEPEMDPGPEMDMGDEAPAGEEPADEDDLVQEVLRRVTRRLVAAKLNRK